MRRLPLHAVPLALVVALLATAGAHAALDRSLASKAAATRKATRTAPATPAAGAKAKATAKADATAKATAKATPTPKAKAKATAKATPTPKAKAKAKAKATPTRKAKAKAKADATAKAKATPTPKANANAKANAKAKPKAKAKPAVVSRGLETILQDDGLLLFRPPGEVQAAVARAKALGVDTIRVTASWSSLTRGVELPVKPEGFDARDPAAYEQARWQGLDTAVRAIRGVGLRALVDIGFWAPRWATTDPGPRARANVDPQAFADFAAAIAQRYAGGFVPPPDPPGTPPPAPSADQSLLQSLLQPLLPFPIPGLIPPQRSRIVPAAGSDGANARGALEAGAAQAPEGGAPAPTEPLPDVDEFALWNEPNHQGLLLPQWEADGTTPASPRVYRAMVRAAYAAVKSVRKHVTVLIGNTSSTGGKRGVGPVPPLEFLRDLACVNRELHPLTTPDCANFTTLPGDGWAHHPYSQNERPSRTSKPSLEPDDLRLADLPKLAATLDALVKMGRLARGNRNIYVTEFGYETQPIPGRPTIDERKQARWLTWAEYLADRVPTVRSFAQFLLRDQPPAAVRVSASAARPFGQYSTGLLKADGRDKIAAKSFVAGLFGQLRSNARVLLYGRLRLGAGLKSITLQRQRPHHGWERIATLRVDGRSAFQRTIAHVPGALYRLGYPARGGRRASSIAIKPVAASG
jgi:hypothetical protein